MRLRSLIIILILNMAGLRVVNAKIILAIAYNISASVMGSLVQSSSV